MNFFRFGLVCLCALFSWVSHAQSYRFQPEDLHQLAKESIEHRALEKGNTEAQLQFLYKALAARYPDQLNPQPKWLFNQTAGALGQLQILYCSPQEYLIFFGSTIGTEGHSGRYDMDVHDFMLTGEMWTALQGELERNTYRPGDAAFLPKGRAKAYKIPEYGYMLEYGRGNVAKAFGQGVLAPAFFLNQDFSSMKTQLMDCGRMAVKNIFHPAS